MKINILFSIIVIMILLCLIINDVRYYIFSNNIKLEKAYITALIPNNKDMLFLNKLFGISKSNNEIIYNINIDSQQIIKSKNNIPKWLKIIKNSKIYPNKGVGKVKLGLKKKNIVNIIGKPDNFMNYDNTSYNSIGYKHNKIGLELIINKKTRKVQRIYLIDWNYNLIGILPSIKNITIGNSKNNIINKFGTPLKKRSLMEVCSIINIKKPNGKAYVYKGIRFRICNCNDKIYCITLP